MTCTGGKDIFWFDFVFFFGILLQISSSASLIYVGYL